jgi:adenylosuccinate synthase
VSSQPIVLLSGAIGSGKSTLGRSLCEKFGCRLFSTRQLILELVPETQPERVALQEAGERLDRQHGGQWVAKAITRMLANSSKQDNLTATIVDSIRTQDQLKETRVAFGSRVIHLHLTAPADVLASRFGARRGSIKESAPFRAARSNPTEARVDELGATADVLIRTDRCTETDVVSKAAAHLGFFDRAYRRLVDALVGGCYGSEGKGHLAAYLAREYDILVRVGGPNAGHTVFEEPKPYTHHHLPSGTRKSEAHLVLAPGCVLDPEKLIKEIIECNVDGSRLSIDPQAMVISSDDRQKEQGLTRSIGSTGQGVGYATARRIQNRGGHVLLAKDIPGLKQYVRETQEVLDRAFHKGQRVLLEGTQGTGLSLYHGSYPHVTSRDTTVAGCLAEAGIAPTRLRRVIMVVRTYPIRVQSPKGSSSGPMGTELSWAEIARRSDIPVGELRRAERTSTTKRRRRVAEFDWALLRRAASLNGPTDIAMTFVDYLARKNRDARRYDQLTTETIRFIEEIERVAAAPASLITVRFDYRSIIDRRAW